MEAAATLPRILFRIKKPKLPSKALMYLIVFQVVDLGWIGYGAVRYAFSVWGIFGTCLWSLLFVLYRTAYRYTKNIETMANMPIKPPTVYDWWILSFLTWLLIISVSSWLA